MVSKLSQQTRFLQEEQNCCEYLDFSNYLFFQLHLLNLNCAMYALVQKDIEHTFCAHTPMGCKYSRSIQQRHSRLYSACWLETGRSRHKEIPETKPSMCHRLDSQIRPLSGLPYHGPIPHRHSHLPSFHLDLELSGFQLNDDLIVCTH